MGADDLLDKRDTTNGMSTSPRGIQQHERRGSVLDAQPAQRRRKRKATYPNPFTQWRDEERERENTKHFDQEDAFYSMQRKFRCEKQMLRQDISSRDNDWLYENRVFYCSSGYRVNSEKGQKA